MRQVIATGLILDDDLFVCLQIVAAQIQFGSCGEEDISILQNGRLALGIGSMIFLVQILFSSIAILLFFN